MDIFLSDKDYADWEREFETAMVFIETFCNKLDKIPVVNYTSAQFRLGLGIGLLSVFSVSIVGTAIKGIFTRHSLNLKDRIIKQISYTDHGIANIVRACVGLLWLAPFELMANPPFAYQIFSGILGYVVCIIYDLQGWRFRYPIEKLTLKQTGLGLERT